MSAQSIVKSSSVADKRPTAAQLAVSEISLNYNEEGAFLCCKDTAGNIQQVGGVKISETAPDNPIKQTIWFQPSTGTISIYDGTVWLASVSELVTSVNGKTGAVVLNPADIGAATSAQGAKADLAMQPGDDISELNNDSNYLVKDDNVSELTNDAGYITFAEIPSDIGLWEESGNYLAPKDATTGVNIGNGNIQLSEDGIGQYYGVEVVAGGGGIGAGMTAGSASGETRLRLVQNNVSAFQITDNACQLLRSTTCAHTAGFGYILNILSPNTTLPLPTGGGYLSFGANQTGATFGDRWSYCKIGLPTATADGSVSCLDIAGFRITNTFGKFNAADDGNVTSAISLELNSRTGKNTYNINAPGSAPSFLAGSIYIGGSVAIDTLELWKSTLTEEQIETLENGKVAVPPNVSSPGDGEFARSWYYNQQDAEIQAELTAGTINYPKHLVAETFVDSFALGDNSNINLLSDGTGEFAVTVKTPKIESASGGLLIEGVGALNLSSGNGNSIVFRTDHPNGNYAFKSTDEAATGNLRFNSLTAQRNYIFPDNSGAIALTSDISSFKNGIFDLAMEADNPNKFLSTLTTDTEGNEISDSVYNGKTEDLLAIIKDLRARVTALEAAK